MTEAPIATADVGVTPHVTAPGDIYELAMYTRTNDASVLACNVFHFRAVTPGCTATSLIVDWRTTVESYVAAMLNGCQIIRYLCFNLIPYQTDVAEQIVAVNCFGAGSAIPPVVTWIITWRTARIGRRYRGRSYMPFLGSASTNGGELQGNLTSASTPWNIPNAILTRYGATGTSPDTRIGVWSRLNGNDKPPHSPDGFTQITSFTIQRYLGSMGTRRKGRGP